MRGKKQHTRKDRNNTKQTVQEQKQIAKNKKKKKKEGRKMSTVLLGFGKVCGDLKGSRGFVGRLDDQGDDRVGVV
jgi:hypothetical protein